MQKKSEDKLGTGSIGKLLFSLAMPNIFAQLVNMLYNVVDRMFIGHIPQIGATALTGVGVAFPLIMLLGAFSSLVGMGGAPHASIKMGEGKKDEAEEIIGNSFSLLMILSVVLTLVFLLFGKQMLVLFGASEATLPYAWTYLKICSIGTLFVQLSLGLAPFISGQGFAKESMIAVLIGAVVNIILDPIFIYGLNMGVAGAAIATVISQALSSIYILYFLTGKTTALALKKKFLSIRKEVILPVLLLGLSPFIMQSTESVLNVAFNRSLQMYGGDVYVGAMTIAASLMQILFLPLIGLTQGSQPIISYNYGAKENDRVRKTVNYLLVVSVVFAGIFWLAIRFFPEAFIAIFSTDPSLVAVTTKTLNIYMAAAFLMGAQIACQQTFLALGQAKISIVLSLLRKIVFLIPFIYIFPMLMNNKTHAVLFAQPVADILSVVITCVAFYYFFNKLLKRNTFKSPSILDDVGESSVIKEHPELKIEQ